MLETCTTAKLVKYISLSFKNASCTHHCMVFTVSGPQQILSYVHNQNTENITTVVNIIITVSCVIFLFLEMENDRDVFAEASSRHQEAAKRHLKEFEDDMNSDEEEDDIGDRMLENVFKSYSNNYGKSLES